MSISSRPECGELIQSALGYANRGWHVVPVHTVADDESCSCGNPECTSRGKHPIPIDWVKLATTDPDTIADYWRQAPVANVGIATGAASGIFVVDLDGPAGIAAFNALADKQGELPATYSVMTGSGGRHLYFRYPADRAVGNRQKINGQPIDVRGDGGQVIAPPSLHQSGKQYAIENDAKPADAPAWLLDLVAPPPESSGSVASVSSPSPSPTSMMLRVAEGGADLPRRIRAYLSACPPAIAGQGGHNQTFSVTNSLIHGFVLTADEAMPYLREWNGTCQPSWTEKELRHKLEDAITKGSPPPGKSRGYLLASQSTMPATTMASAGPVRILPVDPWVSFPVDALPEPLRSLVVEGAKALGCVAGFLAPFVLAIVAGMIGNSRRIRLKRGWTEPAIIWSVVVADSGSMKSPALELVAKVAQKQQSRMFEEHKAAVAEFDASLVQYERDAAEWKRSPGKRQPPEKPVAPICRRIIVSDVTVEKLASILGENSRGLLAVRDELAGWFGAMNQYKGATGADVANWLELHRAGSLTVDRKNGPTIHVRQASVSLTGGIQPAILARTLTAQYRESGLAARLLLTMPPKSKKQWTDAELPEPIEEAFRQLIERLLSLEPKMDAEGHSSPWCLDLTPDAKKVWVDYYNRWGNEQANADGDLAAVFAKIEAYAARLALIHHVVDRVHHQRDDIAHIDIESIEAGIRLADWFANESRRVYAILSESAEERSLRTLRDLITRKGGSITPRELQRSNDRVYRTSEEAQAALIRLQQAGLGDIRFDAPTTGGHSTLRFTLTDARHPTCPTVDSTSNSSDSIETTDTRTADNDNLSANGSSVGRVMRRTEEVDSRSEPEPASPNSSSVSQGEKREVFEI